MHHDWAYVFSRNGTLPVPRVVESGRLNRYPPLLKISERTLRGIANRKAGNVLAILLRQAFREHWLRLWKRTSFRWRENTEACRAYCRMDPYDFEGINARQLWANWRTIPRTINGRLPNRPLKIIDLCCGTGDSTAVLAHYACPGSEIVGLEFNPAFVKRARARSFWHDTGALCTVRFGIQSVLEKFLDVDGQPFQDESVDWVNSCGAVGCHFDNAATTTLAAETARVLKQGGLATIDSGASGTCKAALINIFSRHGMTAVASAKSCLFDSYTQVCFRKQASV